ncbi:adenylate/guanylate cyclase domain-containing protein [Actinomadura parmotrematis]|uniref:Adenylate/guanylate cyclase domain-containing protein n=1 Tax=Actinomadura parmotrematis TaxID=2864039 RepID=A0ABS7FRS3_9ACTN|nr:adenylate/guanylate cyclase domain-containing protein [Actinomadura parmotrematis]MBW8482247.1 adenylate/guanylate cyclase domain-containing protein [Actinomadura parmotrematis]
MRQMRHALARFLDGPPGAPRAELERRIRRLVIVSAVVANAVGALVVLVLATVVLPDPREIHGDAGIRHANLALFFAYATTAITVGVAVGLRTFAPVRRLLVTDRPLTEAEQRLVLRAPLLLMKVHGALWGLAAGGWAAVNLAFSPLMALKLGLTVLLGGLTTCTIVYLVTERLFRPAVALALATRVPAATRVPGVVVRSVLAWGLGTAVPVLGVLLMGAASLTVADVSSRQLSWTMVALAGTALLVGVGVTYLAARAMADPIDSVRRAMARVEQQDLLTGVPVYDGSEIGQLQAGFNQMVAGLREHEMLQDLFGRQVGQDVARLALQRGVELGGEVRAIAVIFVDLVGSTRLAATRPPGEVVGLLNEFFAVVVQVVNAHGGWINKFEGDAALAIFGAPLELPDGPARALAAARELASRLAAEVPQVTAAVGVSAGPAVAGHIGAENRFEYTVIGDPVNEAARLTELAKKTPARVLASGAALDAAGPAEAARWTTTGEVVVRGRLEPTRLAAPTADEPVGN